MIKKDTIVSTTDGRLTLLQWLKKVEKAIKDSTVTGFTATPTEDGKVVLALTFADGSTIEADPIAVPTALDKYIKLNADGNLLDFGLSGAFDGGELYLDGRLARLRSYKEGVWDNVDVEIQNAAGQYITVVRVRKNDVDGRQVRVMGGDLQTDGGATFYNSDFSISNLDRYTNQPAVLNATKTGIYCPEKNITFIGNVSQQYAAVGGNTEEHLLMYESGLEILDDGYVTLYQNKETDLNTGSYTGNGYMISVEEIGDALNDVGTLKSETSKAKYQHTVHITALTDTNKQLNVSFTARSSKSTPVVSYQKLHEVFGGRNLTVSGLIKYWAMGAPIYLDLHGGTISTDKVYFVDAASAGAYQQPALSEFPNITFTDDVVPE